MGETHDIITVRIWGISVALLFVMPPFKEPGPPNILRDNAKKPQSTLRAII